MNIAMAIPTVAASTVSAASGVVVAQDTAGQPTTITVAGIFAAGSTVIGVLWRAWRHDLAQASAERRADDERKQAEMDRLRRRNEQLVSVLLERGISVPPQPTEER